jgi:hypothetical protein
MAVYSHRPLYYFTQRSRARERGREREGEREGCSNKLICVFYFLFFFIHSIPSIFTPLDKTQVGPHDSQQQHYLPQTLDMHRYLPVSAQHYNQNTVVIFHPPRRVVFHVREGLVEVFVFPVSDIR